MRAEQDKFRKGDGTKTTPGTMRSFNIIVAEGTWSHFKFALPLSEGFYQAAGT